MKRRIATALLVTSERHGDLQIYLAERSKELRFFGGYLALPGGTLSPEDLAATVDEAAAMRHCAHRELFEELGLLRHALPDCDLATRRQARHQLLAREQAKSAPEGPEPFGQLVHDTPEPAPLRLLCRVETPPFAPVRYDTEFFHVPLEECLAGTLDDPSSPDGPGAGPRSDIWPDIWPGELTEGRFWRPDQALQAWRRGEILLVPPVVILCEHLAAAADFESFCRAMAKTTEEYRNGRLHQVRFTPGVVLAPLETPTLPPAMTTNCYVVGNKELWVIDPGSPKPAEQQRLLALLDELQAQGRSIAGILSTHHHPDHVGGIAALCKARNLQVSGHPRTLERLPAGSIPGRVLQDGDRIDLGQAPDGSDDWHLTCLHTPGHDQGHLCFHESRYDAVIVGDMLSTMSTIIVDPPEGHLATYLQSLELLLARPMTTLYPAHGPAMRDGHRLVKQYLRHRRQREASLVQHLLEHPGTIDELLPKVYWDADKRLYPFAVRSLLAGLQKLEEEGRAVCKDGLWSSQP